MISALGRFLFLLGVSLWLGGSVFFGALAAPALFRVARENAAFEVAPLTVALILTRFAVYTALCGFLAAAGWALSRTRSRAWRMQGVTLGLAAALAVLQNFVLLPRTLEEQKTVLPLVARAERGQKLSSLETQKRAEFDRRHKRAERLGGFTLLLLLWSLGAFAVGAAPRRKGDLKN